METSCTRRCIHQPSEQRCCFPGEWLTFERRQRRRFLNPSQFKASKVQSKFEPEVLHAACRRVLCQACARLGSGTARLVLGIDTFCQGWIRLVGKACLQVPMAFRYQKLDPSLYRTLLTMQKQALQAGRTKPVGGACAPLHARLRTKVHLAGRHVGIIPDIFRHQLQKINQSLQTRNAGCTVRAAAAAQDAIDVDASVIDDRIPVTVSPFLPVLTTACTSEYRHGGFASECPACRGTRWSLENGGSKFPS